MAHRNAPVKLAKFLSYVLGRYPHEFGLVPDEQGFVRIKELLQVFGEEAGWRHIRRGSLDEVLVSLPEPPIEIQENRIRAVDREQLKAPAAVSNLPKLLYICVRRRAYPVVLDKGIYPGAGPWIVLAANKEMALRMGRRLDAEPVLLTVSVHKSHAAGIRFSFSGEGLYLALAIPSTCFSGPPLPKQRPPAVPEKSQNADPPVKQPGSFLLALDSESGRKASRESVGNRRKGPGWKRDRKKLQKMKRKMGKLS